MNEYHELNEAEIEGWALTFGFDDLTAECRSFVIAKLGSRDAYDRLRSTLLAASATLATESTMVAPHPETAARLRAALRGRDARTAPRESFIQRVLSYRIPAYQGALAAAALVLLVVGLGRFNGGEAPRVTERIVHVPVIDSTRLQALEERMIRRVADSIREELQGEMAEAAQVMVAKERVESGRSTAPRALRDRSRRREQRGEEKENTQMAQSRPNRFVGLANLPQTGYQKRGKTIAEDSVLDRFMFTTVRDTF